MSLPFRRAAAACHTLPDTPLNWKWDARANVTRKEHNVVKFSILVYVGLFALSLTSCTGISNEVADLATKRVQESKTCTHDYQCRDFKVTRLKQMDLTSADKANGIDTRWCIQVAYIFFNDRDKLWQDNNGVVWIEQSQGALKITVEALWFGKSIAGSCPGN